MNIRETIARLNEVAAALPGGLDSELRVHICTGARERRASGEPGVLTSSVEVDTMAEYLETGELVASFAVVQGHPHRDPPSDADEALRKWAGEMAGPDEARGGAT